MSWKSIGFCFFQIILMSKCIEKGEWAGASIMAGGLMLLLAHDIVSAIKERK